jgi:ketosteroid isomerase-like protein
MSSHAAPSPPDPAELAALAAVHTAHQAFYDAFEARDLDAMSEVWEHSDRVVCTHPGWRTLRGWAAVSASWFALFGGPNQLQFILTDEAVSIDGTTAWVSVDENLIGEAIGGTVAGLNVFVFDGERWRMVVHHGAPIADREP